MSERRNADAATSQLVHSNPPTRIEEDWARTAGKNLQRYQYERKTVTRSFDSKDNLLNSSDVTLIVSDSGRHVRSNGGNHPVRPSNRLFRWFRRSEQFKDSTRFIDSSLPADPPYLSARGSEDYRYTILPDTIIDGITVRVMLFLRKEDAGSEQAIAGARLYVEPGTQQLIGAAIQYESDLTFFAENSTFTFFLTRGPENTWLPAYEHVDTRYSTLFGSRQHLEMETRYSHYAPRSVPSTISIVP